MKIYNWVGTFVLVILLLLTSGCTKTDNPAPNLMPAPPTELQNPAEVPGNQEDSNLNTPTRQSSSKKKLIIEESSQDTLVIKPEGYIESGRDASFIVTFQGKPVEGATVFLNDIDIGTTDAEGKIFFIVQDLYDIKLEAVKDKLTGKLEMDFEGEWG